MILRSKGICRRATAALLALGLAFTLGCQSSPDVEEDPTPVSAPPGAQEEAYQEPYQEEAPPAAGYEEPAPPAYGAAVPTSPEEVTEEQAESFASAYVEVMNIQMELEPQMQAATTPEEMAALQTEAEERFVDAVESEDLTVEEFNAIAELLAYDEGLRDRVQSHVDGLVN